MLHKKDIFLQKKETDLLREKIYLLEQFPGVPVIIPLKRKTAAHRPIGDVIVTLTDINGNKHDLIKLNRPPNNTPEAFKQERYDRVKKILVDHNISLVQTNFVKMGIGMRSVDAFSRSSSTKLAGSYDKEKEAKKRKKNPLPDVE